MTVTRTPRPDSDFPANEYDRTRFDARPKNSNITKDDLARQKAVLDSQRQAKEDAAKKEQQRLLKIESEKAKALDAKKTKLEEKLDDRKVHNAQLAEARDKQIADITAANLKLKEKIDELVVQVSTQQASLEAVESVKPKQPVQAQTYAGRLVSLITPSYFSAPLTPTVNALPAFEFKAEAPKNLELHNETVKRLQTETSAYEKRVAELEKNLTEMKTRQSFIETQNAQAAKEQAAKEKAEKEKAEKELAAKEKAEKEKAEKELAAKEKADKEQAAKEAAKKDTSTLAAAKLLAGDESPAKTLKTLAESVKTGILTPEKAEVATVAEVVAPKAEVAEIVQLPEEAAPVAPAAQESRRPKMM